MQIFAKTFFLPFILFSFGFAQAQTVISGRVTSKNRGVPGVNVSLRDTYDGATTDTEGRYSFETNEKGSHTLSFSKTDFAEVEKPIEIGAKALTADAEMRELVSEISAVVITAGTMEASDKKRATAALTPMDIYQTAGANGQITEGYKTLPGVQKSGEAEGLFVRGSTGSETKFYMDGNLVNNYFTASVPGIPGQDRFNTSLFRGSSFSTGGYSAVYGQALSAILALESVDFPEQNSAGLSVFPFSVSGNVQQVNLAKTFSYGLEGKYTNLFLMTKLLNFNTDFLKAPTSLGFNGNFRVKLKNGGLLKYYGSLDGNALKLSQPSLEPDYDAQEPAVSGRNVFQSVSYRQKVGRYLINSGVSFGVDRRQVSVGIFTSGQATGQVLLKSSGLYLNHRTVIERKIKAAGQLRLGYEMNYANDEFENQTFQNLEQNRAVRNLTAAAFMELNVAVTRDFSVSGGLRGEHSTFLDGWNLAPRLAAAYRLSDGWKTSFAYGRFYQNPDASLLMEGFSQKFQSAEHYILQLEYSQNRRTLRGEVFYKNYKDLEKSRTQNFVAVPLVQTGEGYAKGLELFWSDRKSFENLKYRVSYSFLDSRRDYLNYPQGLFPAFASKHNFSVVASRDFPKLKSGMSLTYTYASPRPYYNIIPRDGENFLMSQGRTRDFNVLNFSGYYLPNLGRKEAKSFTILVAGVNNALGFKNIYGYRFSQDGLRSQAVLPTTKTMFYVGAIFNFGIDRTQDTIDKL